MENTITHPKSQNSTLHTWSNLVLEDVVLKTKEHAQDAWNQTLPLITLLLLLSVLLLYKLQAIN